MIGRIRGGGKSSFWEDHKKLHDYWRDRIPNYDRVMGEILKEFHRNANTMESQRKKGWDRFGRQVDRQEKP